MQTIYVTSTETFSGKSALCVGLARRFLKDGLRIGYMKPVAAGPRVAEGLVDGDVEYLRSTFALPDHMDDMAPVVLGRQTLERLLGEGAEIDFRDRIKSAHQKLAQGRDVLLLEGGSNLREGALLDLTPVQVAELLNAREIVVIKYNEDLQLVDDALVARLRLGDSLVGVVLNSVPRWRMPFVQERLRPALERRGVAVLAVLPLERLLQSISVREVAEFVSGELLCGQDKADELVEHLMVGAMGVESALSYFRRKPNKAVITGGDRSDIQLAALETSTKCLVLTGNLRPSPIIQRRAEEVGVPMILVRQDTMSTVEAIERYFGRTRFRQSKKIDRFDEMLTDWCDFERLYSLLNLAPGGEAAA